MAAEARKLTELEKVIRAFVQDGRLVSIPAKPSKRELLLPWLLDRCFPEDRDYEEKEVNQRLALLHPDVRRSAATSSTRGLMTREAGHLPAGRTDVRGRPRARSLAGACCDGLVAPVPVRRLRPTLRVLAADDRLDQAEVAVARR